jgi:uncharacterized membrane protein YdbT with pleckstrin-like domain
MEKHLTPGEKLLYSTKTSRRSKIPRYALAALLLAAAPAVYMLYPAYSYLSGPLAAIGILLLVLSEILLFSNRLYVTSHAVSEREGLFSKKMRSLDMEDIVNITITQNVWQRILKYGEIKVNTAESRLEEVIFPCAANPYSVKRIMEENMRRLSVHHRVQRGLPHEETREHKET